MVFRSDFFGNGASVMELDRKFFVKNNYKNHIKVYSAVLSSHEAGLHNLAFSKLKKKAKFRRVELRKGSYVRQSLLAKMSKGWSSTHKRRLLYYHIRAWSSRSGIHVWKRNKTNGGWTGLSLVERVFSRPLIGRGFLRKFPSPRGRRDLCWKSKTRSKVTELGPVICT